MMSFSLSNGSAALAFGLNAFSTLSYRYSLRARLAFAPYSFVVNSSKRVRANHLHPCFSKKASGRVFPYSQMLMCNHIRSMHEDRAILRKCLAT